MPITKISDINPSEIADRFATVLREWLTADEFEEMKQLNATSEYATGCCASQNYCDANMAMDTAIKQILPGANIDADDETQAAVWNAAWDLARKRHIGAPRMKRQTTDGRYIELAADEWLDATGINTVSEAAVDAYLVANPLIGIVVECGAEE